MCRNIRTLHNFEPPATQAEIRDAALQFVRKLSGASRPSRANEAAFAHAVDRISDVVDEMLGSLVSHTPPRDREVEAERAKSRSAKRFQPA